MKQLNEIESVIHRRAWKLGPASLLAVLALACSSSTPPAASPEQSTGATDSSGECSCAHQHADGAKHGGHEHGGMHAAMHEGQAMSCPMTVPGTTVNLVDLPGAVALEFSTTDDVAELQRRVAAMAEHHRQRHAKPTEGAASPHHGHEAHQGHGAATPEGAKAPHGHGHGTDHSMMVPARVGVEETATGARLVFTPEQSTDLASLREHLAKRSKHMAEGRCGMMHPPPAESPAGTSAPAPAQ